MELVGVARALYTATAAMAVPQGQHLVTTGELVVVGLEVTAVFFYLVALML
jgi:hypothetical protein